MLGAITTQCYAEDITDYGKKRGYYLKVDISNFFNSIDKDILYSILKRDIISKNEQWLLKLIGEVIYNNPSKNPAYCPPESVRKIIPKEKRLNYYSDKKGLPIGNLVSQFFSNIYLNELDQYITKELNFITYCRFADDMIFFHRDAKYLNYIHDKVKNFLWEKLELQIHPRKKSINLISKGYDFIGYVVKPNRICLRRTIVNKSFYEVKKWKKLPDKYTTYNLEKIREIMNGVWGLQVR